MRTQTRAKHANRQSKTDDATTQFNSGTGAWHVDKFWRHEKGMDTRNKKCKQVHDLRRYCLQPEKIHPLPHAKQGESYVHAARKKQDINKRRLVFNNFLVQALCGTLYHQKYFWVCITYHKK